MAAGSGPLVYRFRVKTEQKGNLADDTGPEAQFTGTFASLQEENTQSCRAQQMPSCGFWAAFYDKHKSQNMR